jgi:hypothetical protein
MRRILPLLLCLFIVLPAAAGPREQARRIHDRLAGVPPDASTLDAMAARIGAGDAIGAALMATQHDAFYDVTLPNLVKPWTNRDQSVFVPLNDYVALVVGLVRDDADFRDVLSADRLYVGAAGLGLPAYANTDNRHFEEMEARGLPLRTALVATTQSAVTGVPAAATAGALTTRAAARAFFIDGTNRAMLRFTLVNHLCTDLEALMDTSRPPDRIRQDVTRSPGGDSRLFLNNCVGCHAGMDPLAQAFAYYDFVHDADADPLGESGRIDYNDAGDVDPFTGTRVKRKYRINATSFAPGFVTPDDRWDNRWRVGTNQLVGWSASLPGSGAGARSLGQELAGSDAFARCHARHAFETACLRPPGDAADRAQVDAMTASLAANGFRLRQAFAEAAVHCMGD